MGNRVHSLLSGSDLRLVPSKAEAGDEETRSVTGNSRSDFLGPTG